MPFNLPPMQTLRALEAFARLGSVWRAADELGITRSAVSHQLAQLEEFLGFNVVERSGKGVALTTRGRAYANSVRESLTQLVSAGEGTERTGIDGTLRISSTAGFASMWLCKHISQLHKDYPNLNLEIVTRRDLRDVSDASMDVFIAFGDGNWPNRSLTKLYDVEYLPVCSPVLLNRRGGIESPEDVLRFPLLHLNQRDDWSRWLATHGVQIAEAPPGILFSDMMLVEAAARAGQGIMLGDNVTFAAALSTGELVCPFSSGISVADSYYLVLEKRKQTKPAVRVFCAWIKDLITQKRAEIL